MRDIQVCFCLAEFGGGFVVALLGGDDVNQEVLDVCTPKRVLGPQERAKVSSFCQLCTCLCLTKNRFE